jgi:uncharacterized LabA/DUF88 family protein
MSLITSEKIYAFIDSQNLNLGVRSAGWKLDFKKFRIYLNDKYHVEKAFLFIGYVSGNENLYANLQKYGYILIFKPTLEFKEGERFKIKGNVDAELVLHAVAEKDNYDKAIIVSGDGDFYCLAEYLIGIRKLKKILLPNYKYSRLLKKFSKYIAHIQKARRGLENKRTEISVRSKP